MASGWIKLHRKIMDCLLWDDEPANKRSAWTDLLLLANHEDKSVVFNGQRITIKAGQKITSIRKLAQMWNWSKDRTEKFLSLLESEGMIVKESNHNRTLITIVNYGFYQGNADSDKDSNKDTNKDTNKPQTRIYKNIKKERSAPLVDDDYDESFEMLMKKIGGEE